MARVLGVVERTLFRDWRTARALIHADLGSRKRGTDLFTGSPATLQSVTLSAFEVNTARKMAERASMDIGALLEEDMGLLATAVTAALAMGGSHWSPTPPCLFLASSPTTSLAATLDRGVSGE